MGINDRIILFEFCHLFLYYMVPKLSDGNTWIFSKSIGDIGDVTGIISNSRWMAWWFYV